MKVVVTGGAGRYFQPALEILAKSELVSEIVLAGRTLSSLEEAAQKAGEGKACCTSSDIFDEEALSRLISGADLLINVTGPYFKTLPPVLRAAIRARAPYLDYAEDGRTIEAALALNDEAKAAGIAAVLGMGETPGLSAPLAAVTCSRLDQPLDVVVGWIDDIESVFGEAQETLREIKKTGRVPGALRAVLHYMAGAQRIFRDGEWCDQEALAQEMSFQTPDGAEHLAFVIGGAEAITLPRAVLGLRNVTALAALSPAASMDLMRREAARIASGEIDETQAAIQVVTALTKEPERWLAGERDPEYRPTAVSATGLKNGRLARVSATFDWNFKTLEDEELLGTAGPIALAALKMLSGEVTKKGVLTPETAFEPLSFLTELAERFSLFHLKDGSPLTERFDWLEEAYPR